MRRGVGEADTARGRRRRRVGVGKGLGGAPARCATKVDGSGAASWMKLDGDSPLRRSWAWRPGRGRRVVLGVRAAGRGRRGSAGARSSMAWRASWSCSSTSRRGDGGAPARAVQLKAMVRARLDEEVHGVPREETAAVEVASRRSGLDKDGCGVVAAACGRRRHGVGARRGASRLGAEAWPRRTAPVRRGRGGGARAPGRRAEVEQRRVAAPWGRR